MVTAVAPRRILSVLAVAASVAIAAVTVALWTSVTPNSYSTAIGEHRTVALSDGSTIALGADTRIDVRLSKDVRAIELVRGEARAGIEEPTKMDDSVAGWQTGRLAFRLQPLRYVLEDVNRYAAKPIVLDRVDEGALVITGTVERENIAGWVRSLERAFNLEATEETDRIVLRAR